MKKKLHITEDIQTELDNFKPLTRKPEYSLTDILLNRLVPYEETFMQIKDSLSKEKAYRYMNYFMRYEYEFRQECRKLETQYEGCTWESSNIFTRLESNASPQYWESWSRKIFGTAFSTDFIIVPYEICIKNSTSCASVIELKDGNTVLGIPAEKNKEWLATVKDDGISVIGFNSAKDAKAFIDYYRLQNVEVRPWCNIRRWTRERSYLGYRWSQAIRVGNVVFRIHWAVPTPDTSTFINFLDDYESKPSVKANIRTLIINPIVKKYSYSVSRSDAGDEYANTEYYFNSTKNNIPNFSLIYYSKGPKYNEAKNSITLGFLQEVGDYEGEFYPSDYNNDLATMMQTVEQQIETVIDNFKSSNNVSEEYISEYLETDDEDEWEDVESYPIAFEEADGDIYCDGAYFTILYNPSTGKYSWYSSIEFEPNDVFDTEDEAYEDAVYAHTPDDGSELIVQ